MWHTALDTDEEAVITLNYDPVPPVFELPSNKRSVSLRIETQRFPMASESQANLRMEQVNNYLWLDVGPVW